MDARKMSAVPPIASEFVHCSAMTRCAQKRTHAPRQKVSYSITSSASQRAYLRPQSRIARTIGPRSRPFAVRTYSARGGLIE